MMRKKSIFEASCLLGFDIRIFFFKSKQKFYAKCLVGPYFIFLLNETGSVSSQNDSP